jgi:ribosome-binding factor A
MTKRILRLNELIKKELGQIILKEVEFPKGILATITRVETTSDLISAKVFLSVFPEKFMAQTLKTLNFQIYFLQQELNHKLQMRPVPRLIFCQEKETVQAGRIEELLEKTKEDTVEKEGNK